VSRKKRLNDYLKVDKELVIIFLLVAITALIFFFVSNQRGFLNFFYLPVLLGAYFYGKRYATLAALFSVILISIVAYAYPDTFTFTSNSEMFKILDIATWGGFLIIAGYSMGLLYEKKEQANEEIKKTYRGIIEMLSLIIDSVDQQTQSHSYRVSVVSQHIAIKMGLSPLEVENIRLAALLHDLGKIGVSCEILLKVGKLSTEERAHIRTHAKHGVEVLAPVGGRVLELLPLILHHHEKYDGTGYNAMIGSTIPVGARIIAVADVYDALVSDRPYRKALTPLQAKNEIMTNGGVHFDPDVVEAFGEVFSLLESEFHLMHW
jgi:putative nucleotidyltransferase with HDIG domain